MKNHTLYRSVIAGLFAMLAATLLCVVGNLLCVFSVLPLDAAFAIHGVMAAAAIYLAYLFVRRLRAGHLFADDAEFSAGAARMLILGSALILSLLLWAGTFAVAVFL